MNFDFNSFDSRRARKADGKRGVKPILGPFRKAVLYQGGWWRLFPGVLEALEFAHTNTLIGAKVRCVGDKRPCAEICSFDWKGIFALNRSIPIGHAPMPKIASSFWDATSN